MVRTVRLDTDVSDFVAEGVREVVASGAYGSASQLVDEALHQWLVAWKMGPINQADLQASFERALREPGLDADVVFDRLEAKYLAMAEAAESETRTSET